MFLSLDKPKVSNSTLLSLVLFGFLYYWYGEPMIMSLFAVSLFTTTLFGVAISAIFHKRLNMRVCLIAALGVTFCLSYDLASHAVIFETLEDAMTDVITATGDTVEEDVITGFFAFIRVIIGLGFIIGIVVALIRATSGNDWAPIATALGIAVFAVIAIEVMSNLLVGGGGGGGA